MALSLQPFRSFLDTLGGIATNTAKSVVGAGETFGKGLINLPSMVAADITNNPAAQAATQQRAFGTTNPGQIAAKIGGSTLGLESLVAATPLARVVGTGLGSLGAAPGVIRYGVPAITGGLVNSGFTVGQGVSAGVPAKQLVKPTLESGAFGAALGVAVPAVSDLTKGFIRYNNAQNEYGAVGKNVNSTPEAPQTPKPIKVTTPTVRVTDPVQSAATRISGNLDQPFNYSAPPEVQPHEALDNLLQSVRSADKNAAIQSHALGQAIEKVLPTDAERAEASNVLEGGVSKSAAVNRVAAEMRTLNAKAFTNRSAWDPNVQEVEKYSPRFVTKGPKTEAGLRIGTLRPGASVSELLSPIQSRHNLARDITGFKASDGTTLIGKPSQYNLSEIQKGVFEDDAGKRYQQFSPTKQEINATTSQHGYAFREDIAKDMQQYHLDTLIANNHIKAAEILKNDPRFGIRQLMPDETPGPGEAPIVGVKGLHGYAAPREMANRISNEMGFIKRGSNNVLVRILGNAYSKMTDLATQLIVRNPLIHGQNMFAQATIASGDFSKLGVPGMGNMLKARAALAGMSREDLLNLTDEMAKNGMYLPDYGKYDEGVLSKLTHGLSKYSSRGMASIDLHLRAAAYMAGKDMGLAPEKITGVINHYMGDGKYIGPQARNLGLFIHYLNTIARSLGGQVAHPIEHLGANIVTAALAASYYSLDKALQKATGNKNAYMAPAGELALGKEAFNTAKATIKNGLGNFPQTIGTSGIVLNHTNPIFKEIVQQIVGKDLFTGQSLQGDRLGHAVKQTVSPASIAMQSEGLGGHKSPAELALNQLRAYTPHAPRAPAAPNISALNTKGAKPEAGPDVTGYQPMMATIQAKQKMLNDLAGDKRATDAISTYLDRNVDPKTGNSIELNPQEALAAANLLASNPKALAEMQKYKQTNPSHDPMWNLSPTDLKTFLNYQGTRDTDPEKAVMIDLQAKSFNNGQGLANFVQQRDNWYTQNSSNFNGGTEAAPGTPTYPTISSDTQAKLDSMNQLDSQQRAQLISSNQDVADALSAIAQYSNQKGVAQGGIAKKLYSAMSPQLEKAFQLYSQLPKGTGARSRWIQANPDLWNKITTSLANSELFSLSEQGAKNMYQGESPSQQMLKDISNLGQYDIYKNPTTGVFSINPAAAYAAGSGGGKGMSLSTALKVGRDQQKIDDARLPRRFGKKVRVKVRGLHKPTGRSLRGRASRIRIR